MRQQNVAAAATKSVATMPPKRKTLNKNDLKGEILSRVRGGVNPPLREGVKNYYIYNCKECRLNHLSPKGLVGLFWILV